MLCSQSRKAVLSRSPGSIVCALYLTEEGKMIRFFALKIPDYSSKSLHSIFEKHISKKLPKSLPKSGEGTGLCQGLYH
jgi:phosphoenolpyruvate carboxylase